MVGRCFVRLPGLRSTIRRRAFVEQDPEAIWASVVMVIGECVAWAGGRGRFAGVTISNQRETALAWERESGKAVAPAMSWQCRRSSEICERTKGEAGKLRALSGLPLDPLISASKWTWLLEADEALAARARTGAICFGTVESWLIWWLTGGAVHVCDHTNASRTGLLNLAGGSVGSGANGDVWRARGGAAGNSDVQ